MHTPIAEKNRKPSGKPADASADKPPVILQVLPALRSGGVERGTVEIARAIVKADGVALVASSGGVMTSQLAHCGALHITLPLDTKNPFKIWRNSEKAR